MRTLTIDIGGTGIKGIVLDVEGAPLTERHRELTPQPALPEAVLATIDTIVQRLGEFDRISIGFPGVVHEGVTKTAPNLHPSAWAGFPIAENLSKRVGGKPVKVINDAAIQGLGVIEGKGIELVITLGTGLGCCVYTDGHPVHLELAHHPLKDDLTYEDLIGNAARKAVGKKKWNRRVRKAIAQMEALFNYRRIYIGGGNVKHLEKEALPGNATVFENVTGLLGGIRLWQ
ncbi:MAG: ROK family protein [Minicystis sp.]